MGAAYDLRPGHDFVYPYYRDSRHSLRWARTPRDQFLSLLSKGEDPNSGGRQMPGHFAAGTSTSSRLRPRWASSTRKQPVRPRFQDARRGRRALACGGEASTSGGDWQRP